MHYEELNSDGAHLPSAWATEIMINYWTRLSKISSFVVGEQINYLRMPKAGATHLAKVQQIEPPLQVHKN